jgi:hypothetical protein
MLNTAVVSTPKKPGPKPQLPPDAVAKTVKLEPDIDDFLRDAAHEKRTPQAVLMRDILKAWVAAQREAAGLAPTPAAKPKKPRRQ